MKTLAIETSCDDTSVAIVSFDGEIFRTDKMFAYSQVSDHQKYGWVVPEIASRLHSDKIISVLHHINFDEIPEVDTISVTTHPWLPGSLVVGKAAATFLSAYFDKPLIHVNHIHGHIFSLFLERKISDFRFPMVVLTASGGHNDIYLVTSDELLVTSKKESPIWKFKITKLWQTLDDAAGECFDKVARMLWWSYPWWPRIADKASKWKSNPAVTFKRIFLSKESFDFSFSGMKSQVFFLLKEFEKSWKIKRLKDWKLKIPERLICDIAYEFQEAVVEVLVKKLIRAGIHCNAQTFAIAGGVSCNERLREYLNEYGKKELKSYHPTSSASLIWHPHFLKPVKKVYSTDNGAMIWVAGMIQ